MRLIGDQRAPRVLFVLAAVIAFLVLMAPRAMAAGADPDDEILFYRATDGAYRYYDMKPSGVVGTVLQSGTGYSLGWTSITAVDLDGGGQDEMFFYRATDGAFRYYEMKTSGAVGTALQSGTGYSLGWTSIAAVDLDGDGRDEMFFYRATDGAFRYYDMRASGSLGNALQSGVGYSLGWTSITAVDLDGDGRDEMFFYRAIDGAYRYYDMRSNGTLGNLIAGGTGYSLDWDVISAIDLDGDRQDELLFYNQSGRYAYYPVSSQGALGSPLTQGDDYSQGWSVIRAVNLHGDLPIERVSRFTTFFNCCEARVTNIRTMARAVNGTVVMPGETFSIDELIGPRTSAKGYVPAGYLLNGTGQCCAVGGGVSQFGTTIHNAVFWGGYQVVRHQPHTGWISRYPLGIEATLVYQSIDYRFTNNTPTPVTIRTSSTGSSVTVELWGYQGGWQMSGHHPSGARSSSISVIDRGGADAKRVSATVTGSAPGSVRVVRRLTQGGSTTSQTWFWHYVS